MATSSYIIAAAWPYVDANFDIRLLQVECANRTICLNIVRITWSSISFGYPDMIKSELFWLWRLKNTAYHPKIRRIFIYYWKGWTFWTNSLADFKVAWHWRYSESQNPPFILIGKSKEDFCWIKEKTIWINIVRWRYLVFY